MTKSTISSWPLKWNQDTSQISNLKHHLIKVVGPFLLLVSSVFFLNLSAKAQQDPSTSPPLSCDHIECTSNDVRPVKAYITGPGGVTINCADDHPFDNAELHLVVSTNANRQGIEVSFNLNVDGTQTAFISYLFCDNLTGLSNDLVFDLNTILHDVNCDNSFTLTDVFLAWGTGQAGASFCDEKNAPCPQTPAKCRFKPGEVITVALDVDFDWQAGACPDGNLTVDFTPSVTATNVTYPLNFDWDFGDNTTHVQTTANTLADVANEGTSHTYASAGTYTVILTVTDANNVTKSISHDVTVNDCENSCLPALEDCTDDLYQCATPASDPATAVFDLTKSTCNSQVNGGWFTTADFAFVNAISDPTQFTAQDGTVVYGLIFNDCDSKTATVTLHVNLPPNVTAGSNSPVCAGSTLNLTSGPDGDSYSWTGPNNYTNGTQNPSISNVAAVNAGTYIVTVTDANTCSATASTSVTVNPLPTVSAGSDVSICNGGSTTLTASGATSYSWSPGTGLSATTGTSVTANPTSTTTYTVTGTDGNGCTNTAQVTVTVNSIPSCTISNTTSSGSHTSSVAQPVHFSGPSAPSGSTYTYAWSFTGSNTAAATFSGGVSTATTQNVVVTPASVGVYTLSLKVTDVTYTTSCSATCTYAMTIDATNTFYSVTQGFYGNLGGKTCTPSGVLYTSGAKGNTPSLIAASIGNMPLQNAVHTLFLGVTANNRTFTMHATTPEENNLIKYLPAGQAATVITADQGSNNNTNITSNLPKIYNKKISDVLLGQTITLDLNVYIPGNNLGGFVLHTGYLTTQKADLSSCPATKVISCSKDNTAISSLQISTNAALNAWINGKTVQDLLNLASYVLGGGAPPTGVTLSDINYAVNVINTSFDGGRFFIGYYATQKSCASLPTINQPTNVVTERTTTVDNPTVSAYPNPFNDKVKFVIRSPVSGRATLEVFNMLGQKIRTVFNGQLFAGQQQIVEFNVPIMSRVNMVYILKVNGQQLVGKLINAQQ
jgi:PKD repeat protein